MDIRKSLRIFTFFSLLFLLSTAAVQGQQASDRPLDPADTIGEVDNNQTLNEAGKEVPHAIPEEPTRITTDLLRRPVYEGIAKKIRALRRKKANRKGKMPERRPTDPPQVGDTHVFEARKILNQSEWRTVESRLVHRSSQLFVWVATSEYNTLRTESNLSPIIDSLSTQLEDRLPESALASDGGILKLAKDYLGRPPNVDGDERLDILLLDIKDGFSETGSYVAGYFDPLHLTQEEHSNRRDMLFVDTRPTLVFEDRLRIEEAAATVAHEYQHLIHAGYEGEERENAFVNEGLSEVTEIMCGFPPRPADSYFQSPGRALFSWNYSDSLPDYARASLFTHYLFERIGYQHVSRLVQSAVVGQEGVQSLLRSAGGPPLERLFRDWGRALFASPSTQTSVRHYRHPKRRDIRFEDVTGITALPTVQQLQLPSLSHASVRFPLTKEIEISTQGKGGHAKRIRFSGRTTYPEGGGRFEPSLQPASAEIRANEGSYGSIDMLVSNTSLDNNAARPSAPDSNQTVGTSMLVKGTRSGTRLVKSYDDGTADPYSGSASYLLLDNPKEGVGLTFDPERNDWLFGVSVKILFLSEIEGTDVPPSAPRKVTLRVHRLEDGRPGAPITPPITRSPDRPFGNANPTFISLQDRYDALSTLQDSFVVTLRSASGENPLAVALDQSPEPTRENAGSAFYTGAQHWTPMSSVQAEGARLRGFRPILRAHIAVQKRSASSRQLQADIERDLKQVFVRLHAPFRLKPDRTRVAAKLPSGNLVNGRRLDQIPNAFADSDTSGTFFTLPLQGGKYVIHAGGESHNKNQLSVQNTFRWSPSLKTGFEIGNFYPNPTSNRESINVRLVLLDDSRIKVSLYDVQGRLVRSAIQRRALTSGAHRLRLQTDRLASGTYFARVTIRRERDGLTRRLARKVVVVR